MCENLEQKAGEGKVKKQGSGNYFGKREEQAVLDYINSENDVQRQRIFNDILKPAFTKMIESLIRRYGLFAVDETFEETFNDTMGFLMLKIKKFDANKGYKAYSYCGTVCKNYLIRKRKDSQKNETLTVSFNPTYGNGLSDSEDNSEKQNETNLFNKRLIEKMSVAIRHALDNKEAMNLNENECKTGEALLHLLDDWETVFNSFDDDQSKKYNKLNVIYYLTENTLLKPEEISNAMKRFKLLYYIVKGEYLENIYKGKEEVK